MENYITEAVYDTFKKQFDIAIEKIDSAQNDTGYYASSIEVTMGRQNRTVTIYSEKELLKNIAEVLLFEENPDEETVVDLNNELANLIIGHSKVIASDDGYDFVIATPKFLSSDEKAAGSLCFRSDMGTLVIGL